MYIKPSFDQPLKNKRGTCIFMSGFSWKKNKTKQKRTPKTPPPIKLKKKTESGIRKKKLTIKKLVLCFIP